jgi:hypothetical protein
MHHDHCIMDSQGLAESIVQKVKTVLAEGALQPMGRGELTGGDWATRVMNAEYASVTEEMMLLLAMEFLMWQLQAHIQTCIVP